jgi:hypothetical protein
LDTYSIQLRMQRTTTEHAFLSVPVTSDILDFQPDGTARINAEKMMAAAVKLAAAPMTEWIIEETAIQPHPIQRPKHEGE